MNYKHRHTHQQLWCLSYIEENETQNRKEGNHAAFDMQEVKFNIKLQFSQDCLYE